MRLVLPRTSALSVAALAVVLTAGCADVSGKQSAGKDVVTPVKTLPAPVVSLSPFVVGEYYVTPRKDLTKVQLDASIKYIRTMKAVQSADLTKDGRVDVQFLVPDEKAHIEVLKYLVSIGTVEEGV